MFDGFLSFCAVFRLADADVQVGSAVVSLVGVASLLWVRPLEMCTLYLMLSLFDAALHCLLVAVYVAVVIAVDDSGLSMKRSKLRTVWSLCTMLLLVLDLDVPLLSDVSGSHLFVVDVILVVGDIEDDDVVLIDVVLVVEDVEDDDVVVIDVAAANDVKQCVLQRPSLWVADDRCGVISDSSTQPGDG